MFNPNQDFSINDIFPKCSRHQIVILNQIISLQQSILLLRNIIQYFFLTFHARFQLYVLCKHSRLIQVIHIYAVDCHT